jgi:glucose/arabinose dehydrogenase
MRQVSLFGIALAVLACACSQQIVAPSGADWGPNPTLVAPQESALPTVKIARVVGWADNATPTAPSGFTVTRFAEDLAHPRWMYVLPNGDVLVAEAATQAGRGGGFMGWASNFVQRQAGAIEQSPDRITLLRDTDGDGDVDTRSVLIAGLKQPFGMAFTGNTLFVANTDAVLRFPYTPGETQITAPGEKIVDLPFNESYNGHWTRDLLLSRDGTKLYISVGSVSNVPDEGGMAVEQRRANILEVNLDGSGERIFASGLRNPNGLAWEPTTGALWVAVNERDALGDSLVPDYMTSVRDGAFYGWPYSYYGQHVDTRVTEQNADLVARAIAPDYALGAHTASLGLAFYTGATFPERYHNGVFVGQHGSWNRSTFAGYKVVFVPFSNGQPAGAPEDFLTGFLNGEEQAPGRPVGVAVDRTGALLVADDVGNIVWRVAPNAPDTATPTAAP